MKILKTSFCLVLLLVLSSAVSVRAQSDDDEGNVANASAEAAKQLSSRDPIIRQGAAEELAQLVATDQRKLLEGYRLQEKNARVKLALDWALYRIGKTESLFAVVQALDSSRFNQANSYLITLEKPDSLYLFLERMNGNTQVKLLDVLAKIGDAETLDKLKPYAESFDPKVAEAAQLAAREIEQRMGQTPADTSTRPRQVGGGETSP
jgi:HEAT repeat protein